MGGQANDRPPVDAPARTQRRVPPPDGSPPTLDRPGGDQVEHPVRGLLAGCLDEWKLLRREARQHVVRDLVPVRWPADADLHASELIRAQGLDDGADALVAAVAALHPDAHDPERQVDVVVRQDQLRRREPEPGRDARHRRGAAGAGGRAGRAGGGGAPPPPPPPPPRAPPPPPPPPPARPPGPPAPPPPP